MRDSNLKLAYTRLYKAFRKELDNICVPLIIDELKKIDPIMADGKIVGMVGGFTDYIDCVYVEPEYRGKGLASKAVLNFCKNNFNYGIRLRIINNNIPALNFWNKLFELKNLGGNDVDTLYEIECLKKVSDKGTINNFDRLTQSKESLAKFIVEQTRCISGFEDEECEIPIFAYLAYGATKYAETNGYTTDKHEAIRHTVEWLKQEDVQ